LQSVEAIKYIALFRLQNSDKLLIQGTSVGSSFKVYVDLVHVSTSGVFYANRGMENSIKRL